MNAITEPKITDCQDGYTLLDLTKDSFSLGPSRSNNDVWTVDFILVGQNEVLINGGQSVILSSYMNARVDGLLSGEIGIDYFLFDKQRLCGLYTEQTGFILDRPEAQMLANTPNPRPIQDAKEIALGKKANSWFRRAFISILIGAGGMIFSEKKSDFLFTTTGILLIIASIIFTICGLILIKTNRSKLTGGELFAHKIEDVLDRIEGRRLLAKLDESSKKINNLMEKQARLKELNELQPPTSEEHEDMAFAAIIRGDVEWINDNLIIDLVDDHTSEMMLAYAIRNTSCVKALLERGLRCHRFGAVSTLAMTSENFPVMELFIKYIPEFDAVIYPKTRAKFDAWRESGRPASTSENAVTPTVKPDEGIPQPIAS